MGKVYLLRGLLFALYQLRASQLVLIESLPNSGQFALQTLFFGGQMRDRRLYVGTLRADVALLSVTKI